jgi:hypothetical protein
LLEMKVAALHGEEAAGEGTTRSGIHESAAGEGAAESGIHKLVAGEGTVDPASTPRRRNRPHRRGRWSSHR